jgi:tetratricopeptide (TPR) repeat protein
LNLGVIHIAMGSYNRACPSFQKALDTARHSGNRTVEGLALNALGSAYLVLSDHRKAFDYFEQALAIAREVKNRKQECIALGTLGFARQQFGEYQKSIDSLNQALAILRELKYPRCRAEHSRRSGHGTQCPESTRQGDQLL